MKTISILIFLSILFLQCKTGNREAKEILVNQEHKANEQEDTSNSLEEIEQQIIENPESPNGYTKRSYYYAKQGDFKRALEDISRALTITPEEPSLNFTKAELLFNQAGMTLNALLYDQSEIYLNNTIKLDSSYVDAYILKAKIYIGRKNAEEAIGNLSEAIKISPTLSEPYALKGFVYQRLGNTQLAQSSYQTALEMDANNYDANTGLGYIYYLDTNANGLIYFDAAMRLDSNAIEPVRNKGLLLKNLGRIEAAKTAFNHVLQIDSLFEEAYYNLGVCEIDSYDDNFEEKTKDSIVNNAIHYFQQAVNINPEYVQALYNLGYSYEFKGDKKSALKYYKQAIEIAPDYELVNEALRRF
ncbi:MAG: tetratricopeptide repeat protein [Flavobacteriales bacterium]|jgi:tetratricopeptide (TPR) repeat protein|nr:tetratricopeptide repeat protein [Flavobacteriales bacterium]